MRSRLILFTFALYLAFALGCSKQPAADNSSDPNATDQNAPASAEQGGSSRNPKNAKSIRLKLAERWCRQGPR